MRKTTIAAGIHAAALLFAAAAIFAAEPPQPIPLTDEVGKLTVGPPPVGDKPKASQAVFAPGITKEFRFVGTDGSAAVIVSTKIRADLPKDDRVIERIKPRYERTRDGFEEGQAQLRIIGEAPNRVLEFVLLNNDYTSFFPQVLGRQAGKKEIESIGVSQFFVAKGRLVECALHLLNEKKLPEKELIAHAQQLCTQWRQSVEFAAEE